VRQLPCHQPAVGVSPPPPRGHAGRGPRRLARSSRQKPFHRPQRRGAPSCGGRHTPRPPPRYPHRPPSPSAGNNVRPPMGSRRAQACFGSRPPFPGRRPHPHSDVAGGVPLPLQRSSSPILALLAGADDAGGRLAAVHGAACRQLRVVAARDADRGCDQRAAVHLRHSRGLPASAVAPQDGRTGGPAVWGRRRPRGASLSHLCHLFVSRVPGRCSHLVAGGSHSFLGGSVLPPLPPYHKPRSAHPSATRRRRRR